MDTNVEDNIHRLRLRLIDSDLNHQRRSTDEYLKRTHRIGIDTDLQNTTDIERELEILRIQESLDKRKRSNQPLPRRNYSNSTLSHTHGPPPTEKQLFASTNMDDLIDSMARRHLAYRRLDAAIERQRHNNQLHASFMEPLSTGRSSSFRQQQLQDDILHTNRSNRNQLDHDLMRTNPTNFNRKLRSRIDYYNRIQPDPDVLGLDDSMNINNYSRLPPISSRYDSTRYNHIQKPLTPSPYDIKHDNHMHANHQRTFPTALNGHTEPYIELPSDIYLTSRPDEHNASKYNQQTHRSRQKSVSKDRSDAENQRLLTDRDNSRYKKIPNINRRESIIEKRIANSHRTKFRQHLFKKVSIAVLFIINLRHRAFRRREHQSKRSPSATIHKIHLQEIIVALHRVYLQPEGAICNALIQAVNNSIHLNNALNTKSKDHAQAIKIIGNTLQIVITKITEIMPKDGALGTEKDSAISALIQNGNSYPENYFWKCERDQLEFDKLKVINITKQRAILLLIGVFIFRALITTLLLKPVKYRLLLGQITSNQSANLKVLSSVMLYVGRRAVESKSKLLALPHEWQLSLHSDKDIEPIIQNSEINSIITKCDQSLRIWCEEYIRRIDTSCGKKLRI